MADHKATAARLAPLGFPQVPLQVHLNPLPSALVEHTLRRGETVIFFGPSGTGKTTLSTDPARAHWRR